MRWCAAEDVDNRSFISNFSVEIIILLSVNIYQAKFRIIQILFRLLLKNGINYEFLFRWNTGGSFIGRSFAVSHDGVII